MFRDGGELDAATFALLGRKAVPKLVSIDLSTWPPGVAE